MVGLLWVQKFMKYAWVLCQAICLYFVGPDDNDDDNDDSIIEDILVLMPTIFWG